MLSSPAKPLKVLIGCETSGVVRRAFAALGHDVWSCDLLPADDGSNRHIVCDVRDLLGDGWDLLAVMHPPCTRLIHYLGKREGRAEKSAELEVKAAKEALKRIDNLEKNNASFRNLDPRHQCLVFARDSRLPDSTCDD